MSDTKPDARLFFYLNAQSDTVGGEVRVDVSAPEGADPFDVIATAYAIVTRDGLWPELLYRADPERAARTLGLAPADDEEEA